MPVTTQAAPTPADAAASVRPAATVSLPAWKRRPNGTPAQATTAAPARTARALVGRVRPATKQAPVATAAAPAATATCSKIVALSTAAFEAPRERAAPRRTATVSAPDGT